MYTEKPTQKPQNIELINMLNGDMELIVARPRSPKNFPAMDESIRSYDCVKTPANTSGKPKKKKVL